MALTMRGRKDALTAQPSTTPVIQEVWSSKYQELSSVAFPTNQWKVTRIGRSGNGALALKRCNFAPIEKTHYFKHFVLSIH